LVGIFERGIGQSQAVSIHKGEISAHISRERDSKLRFQCLICRQRGHRGRLHIGLQIMDYN